MMVVMMMMRCVACRHCGSGQNPGICRIYIYIYYIYIIYIAKATNFLVSRVCSQMLQIWQKKTAPMPLKGFLFSSVKLILNVTGAISLMQSIGMFHLAGPRARAGTSWFLSFCPQFCDCSGGARGGWLSWNIVPHCPFGPSPAQSAAYSAGCSQSNARHNFTRDPLLERMIKNAGLTESQWCWDAFGQELQSLTLMEARTDKQTITSWQMCAPCCYRRCTLWGIWRCRWWRRSPSCLRQAMSKQAYLFVKNACAWQVLRSDFQLGSSSSTRAAGGRSEGWQTLCHLHHSWHFGRSIEVMCGRSGDHISVIYLSEPVARVSDETLEALARPGDAASMCWIPSGSALQRRLKLCPSSRVTRTRWRLKGGCGWAA